MRYYVIAPDGQRYGPADVETLNAWITEGRVTPNQLLEEEGSGTRVAASAVPGLVFPQQTNQSFAGGQPYQNYYPRGGGPTPGGVPFDDGKQDVTYAWICGALGLCCCLGSIGGIYYANRAKQKGHPGAMAPMIFSIVMLCLSVLWGVFNGIAAAGRGLPH